MRYQKDRALIEPEHEIGENEMDVLVALGMAAYEMSLALDTEDPDEVFPSKGFLFRSEVATFITEKPYGPQIVMDIAFDRLIMLDVRPEIHYDPANGHEDRFVLSVQKFGCDPRRGRTPEVLIAKANALMSDVQDGFARLYQVLCRQLGEDFAERIFGLERKMTRAMPPPPPPDALDDIPEPEWDHLDPSVPGPDDAFAAFAKVVSAEELDASFAAMVPEVDPIFGDGSEVVWMLDENGEHIMAEERIVGDASSSPEKGEEHREP